MDTNKPKRTRRTKAEMAAHRLTLASAPPEEVKQKRRRRSKAEMLASKPTVVVPTVIPEATKPDKLDEAANWITEQMDDVNRQYLSRYAKKKDISLEAMVKIYILQEFGIKQACLSLPK